MEYFVLGQVVRLTHAVYSDAGVLTNAATITLTITLPDGTTTTPTPIVNTGTGSYRYDYTTAQAGRHTYRWTTTAPIAPDDGTFDVHPTTAGIISFETAKAHLNITAATTTDDEELRGYIEAATEVVERHTGKTVVRRTITEHHTVSGASMLWLDHRPVLALTSVATYDAVTTWNVPDLHLDDDLGLITVTAGSTLTGHVVVTYVAGMQIVPSNYRLAAGIIVQHLWQTQRGTRGGPRVGGMDDTATVIMGYAIPNRALELLGPTPPMVA